MSTSARSTPARRSGWCSGSKTSTSAAASVAISGRPRRFRRVLHFFVDRLRGVAVLTLVVFAWTYGFVILNILPQWHRLEAAQGGREVQTRAFASPDEIAATLRTFDAQMRQDAITFYVLDV